MTDFEKVMPRPWNVPAVRGVLEGARLRWGPLTAESMEECADTAALIVEAVNSYELGQAAIETVALMRAQFECEDCGMAGDHPGINWCNPESGYILGHYFAGPSPEPCGPMVLK